MNYLSASNQTDSNKRFVAMAKRTYSGFHNLSPEVRMQIDPWRVVHVLSNHEKRVAQHLAVRSVEHYLPLYTERVKWTDRTVVAERPLFAGYLFVRFPTSARLSVISTPGILRVLGDGERDMVSGEELDNIAAGLESGLLLRPHPAVTVGTKVRVRDGIFAGVEGMVTELRHHCKIVISLSAVHQSFSLELELDRLEVLRPPVPKHLPQPVFAFSN